MSEYNYPKIIAVDFDGTLCENKWPSIGAPNEKVLNYISKQQDEGAKIILWTCRSGNMLKEAVDWCFNQGLVFDAVNENLPNVIENFGGDTRKIFANEYIDDKNSSLAIEKNSFLSCLGCYLMWMLIIAGAAGFIHLTIWLLRIMFKGGY